MFKVFDKNYQILLYKNMKAAPTNHIYSWQV